MSKRALVIGAAVASVASLALAAEPTTRELIDQIKQLQSKVEQLEAKQNKSSADVAATVDKIVEDATKRSQLLQTEGMNILAGHEHDRFFIRSDDGNYLLSPSFELQIRNVTNLNTEGDDSVENGFEIRRLKLRLEGNAVTPDLTYAVQWQSAASGGALTHDRASGRYKIR